MNNDATFQEWDAGDTLNGTTHKHVLTKHSNRHIQNAQTCFREKKKSDRRMKSYSCFRTAWEAKILQ